ncbi:hypothetical protein FGO68_gene3733 [Halteria grandinella]|uniref:Uncharacterized protein n=1 Tax=Halteria grandinella TaxID=5974 RepID=A0A8J8P671_HALGN|nr:hypothetical protein FGO68_gene3733 [Halteria grandinella]
MCSLCADCARSQTTAADSGLLRAQMPCAQRSLPPAPAAAPAPPLTLPKICSSTTMPRYRSEMINTVLGDNFNPCASSLKKESWFPLAMGRAPAWAAALGLVGVGLDLAIALFLASSFLSISRMRLLHSVNFIIPIYFFYLLQYNLTCLNLIFAK